MIQLIQICGESMSYVTDQMRESLRNHKMEEIPSGEGIRVFRLFRNHDERMMSTHIVFYGIPREHRIAIFGDLCPRPEGAKNGIISDLGYDLEWFSGQLSESYLCEKFLNHVWQCEVAARWCHWEIDDIKKGDSWITFSDEEKKENVIEELFDLKSSLDGGEMNAYEFYDILSGIAVGYVDDGVPGYEYPLSDAGWLCAIQQKFSELFVPMQKV